MIVQNQSPGGVLKNLKNTFNTKILFQILAKLPLTITETELGYFHHLWSVRVAPIVALRS